MNMRNKVKALQIKVSCKLLSSRHKTSLLMMLNDFIFKISVPILAVKSRNQEII